MAISGMPAPEICFLPGQFRRTILPKEHHGESLGVYELSHNFPIEWWTLPLSYRRPSEMFVANAQVSGECYVQLGRYWETNDTRKRILALTIYRDFMQIFLNQILRGGQYKPKTTGALTFLVCGRMSSLSFVQSTSEWDYWNGFVWRGRCRDWGTIGPQVSMPVNRERKKIFCPPWKNIFWM